MVSLPDSSTPNKSLNSKRTDFAEQIIPLIVLTAAWCLFVSSAFSYQHLSWFAWLLASRLILVLTGIGLITISLCGHWLSRNRIFGLLIMSLGIQASHGLLESPSSTEFYNFSGLLFLAACLGYRGTFNTWLRIYAPLQLTFLAVPLFFKDRSLLLPVGHFVDHFSLIVAGVGLGTIIARINSVKFQALVDVIVLKDEILAQKKAALQIEADLRHNVQLELESAKEQIRLESGHSALADIASQVAHDIRSPLAALDSHLGRTSQLPEEERLIVRRAVSRIKDIANNLIEKNRELMSTTHNHKTSGETTSSLTTDRHVIQLLSSLVDPLISEKRMQFRSKIGIEIDCRIDAGSYGLFAKIQPTEFKRVLSNLINNSIEAMGEQGVITISLAGCERQVGITIQDNGKGIPPEILAKLGQRGETHSKAGGSGLGLYHARTSVESWGGKLEIKSKVTEGTIVVITLPQASAPSWFVSELRLVPGIPIIILDDDTSIHQIWQGRFDSLRILDKGIEIKHLSTPEQLRTWITENPSLSRTALYLADYELLGYQETGLSLIESLNLGPQSILVTSRFEERSIIDGCQRLQVRMIPKGMAGFVPISFETPTAVDHFDAILIDDDVLVHMTWSSAAKNAGKRIKAFTHPDEFFLSAGPLHKSTPVYVDVNLGNGISGEAIAERIHKMGYTQVYLATGYEPDNYKQYTFLAGVMGKEPPWCT